MWLTIVIVTGARVTESDNIVCETSWFTFFCLTDFPVVLGDETGDDITKAATGNTVTADQARTPKAKIVMMWILQKLLRQLQYSSILCIQVVTLRIVGGYFGNNR